MDPVTTTSTLSSMLGDIGTVFSSFIGLAGNVCSTIVSTPLLLIGVSIPLAGAAIGFFNRLRRIR